MPPAPSRKNFPRAAEGSPSVTLRPSGEVAFEKNSRPAAGLYVFKPAESGR
jgi:hypothetical protein